MAVGDDGGPADSVAAASRGTATIPFGDYELLERIAEGGMGVVFRARQTKLNRIVALKMMRASQFASAGELQRFRMEAEAIARLDHSGIVPIYEVGEHAGQPFFSMAYMEGGSLAGRIEAGVLPHREAAALVGRVARAVAFAHSRGVLHRDLKPANILLDGEGQPKIADFGIAKLVASDSGLTESGQILGTPSYLPPEQAEAGSRAAGPAADIYSLGALLYCALTGRPPFQAPTVFETLEQVRNSEPTSVRRFNAAVDEDLETICFKCLRKDPSHRYASAEALADDLDRFLSGQPIVARPVGNPERLWRWCRRNPRVATLAATTVGALVAGLVVSMVAWIEAADARDQARSDADAAVKQSQLALDSFRALVREVQHGIGDEPGLQDLKLRLLDFALERLDLVAKDRVNVILLQQTIAAAYMEIGQIFRQLGHTEKAAEQYRKCHELMRREAERYPQGLTQKTNLASTLITLADISSDLHDDTSALDYSRQALALRREVVARLDAGSRLDPIRVKEDLAEGCTRMGVCHVRRGDPGAAREYFAEALEIRRGLAEAHPDHIDIGTNLARSHNALATVAFRLRDWEEARRRYQAALELNARLSAKEPSHLGCRLALAQTLGNFGEFSVRARDGDAAERFLRRSLDLLEELAALDARNTIYQRYLALANYRIAVLAARTGDSESARRSAERSIEIREKLVAIDPTNERRRMEWLLSLARGGRHEQAAEGVANVLASARIDGERWVEIGECFALCAAAAPPDSESSRSYSDRAIEAVERAISEGYKDAVTLDTDPDLDSIRRRPEFEKLLATLTDS